MTLGSAELAPLFYFTPIAYHFASILKLTEAVCVPSSLSILSIPPEPQTYYNLSSPFFLTTLTSNLTIIMAPSSTSNGHSNGAANGHARERTPLRPGIYSPTMTFFDPETEELDIPAIKKHAVRLAQAGLVGLVTMGSNGEAVHLSRAEKTTVTRATREALDEAGFQNVPVMVGASEHGIKLTIELCKEAEAAGGEYVLIVPPSYYRYAIDEDAIYEYFTKVADASPLPIVLYNYPGAVAGIDMDSDLIIKLAKHPNIVGTKFTCGNTGKLTSTLR